MKIQYTNLAGSIYTLPAKAVQAALMHPAPLQISTNIVRSLGFDYKRSFCHIYEVDGQFKQARREYCDILSECQTNHNEKRKKQMRN